MQLTLLDWLAIAAYFAANVAIGLYYRRRATGSTEEYFVSGRDVSWWLAGTSMVATTFAADTPLAVTGLVASFGIAGNWLWWSMLMSGMLTVFFYARLWRRAGVLTDVEFAEIRYAGRPAAFLRGFRALYLGLPINCIIMGWVNLAMVKILAMIFGVTKGQALAMVFGMMLVTAFVSTLSGLWGVLVMDLFQFVLKMGMVIVLAVCAVRAVGGMAALKEKLHALDVARAAEGGGGSILSFLPDIGSAWMPMLTFFVYVAVSWWATWYPGAEPGGGGFVAQRIFCAKDEKHSPARHALVQRRALRRAPLALDPHRAREPRSLPRPRGQGVGVRQDDRGPGRLPGRAARGDDRGLRRRLHVHDRHPAQLGRVLPGERLLPALPRPPRDRAALRAASRRRRPSSSCWPRAS